MRDQGIEGSQDVRDPALSREGALEVEAYGPAFRQILASRGFDLDNTFFASSGLRRARQTLDALVPGREHTVLPLFGENGKVPENTPTGQSYRAPNLNRTIVSLPNRDCVIVGHGSFLSSTVWPKMTGTQRSKLRNLDAFIVTGEYRKGPVRSEKSLFVVKTYVELPFKMPRLNRMSQSRKSQTKRKSVNQSRRKSRRQSKTRRQSKQTGGMSLGFFSPGAQEFGTSPTMTGRGLEMSDGTWARVETVKT